MIWDAWTVVTYAKKHFTFFDLCLQENFGFGSAVHRVLDEVVEDGQK